MDQTSGVRTLSTPFGGATPAFKGRLGVAKVDISPPVGIYSRTWGASEHDVSTGLHRPFFVTALTLQSTDNEPPLVLVALDGSWWQDQDDEAAFRGRLLERFGFPASHLMVNLSHTHAGPPLVMDNQNKPGGEYVLQYFETLHQATAEAIDRALAGAREAVLSWTEGSCDLARNRDLADTQNSRYVTGFNPSAGADATVLIGRVALESGETLATLVNYACHPTTLAWENRLLSPDYVGAMRETVESHTGGAPCLFLLGACGELAPAHQYVGDVEVADGHGRRLGHSVCAALEGMLPPQQELAYQGVVESGAPLGIWRPERVEPAHASIEPVMSEVPIGIKNDLPSVQELSAELAACEDPVLRERLQRKLRLRRSIGEEQIYRLPVWLCRAGQTLFVGAPVEAYSAWQIALREAFPSHAVVVMNLVNGALGYLPPSHLYQHDIYSVWQTPFDQGGLESLLERTVSEARRLIEP